MTQITYHYALAPPPPQSLSSSAFNIAGAMAAAGGAIDENYAYSSRFAPLAPPPPPSSTRSEGHRTRRTAGGAASRRKPLEQSRLSAAAARSRRTIRELAIPTLLLHASGDTTEFYTNIWTAPPTSAGRRRESVHKFVDISQVAYVLSTIDFRDGYATPPAFVAVNIWDLNPSAPSQSPPHSSSEWSSDAGASRNSMSVEASHSPRYLSNLTNISEAADEDDDVRSTCVAPQPPLLYLSNSTESPPASSSGRNPPTTTASSSRRLRQGISEEDLAHVASIPISSPRQRGNSVVFSPVLAASPDAIQQTWHARFLLGLHEPVRHALFVIDRFLDRIQQHTAPTEWNVSEFFRWFSTHFVEFIKNQHDIKTKVLVPLLALERQTKRDVVACYARIYVVLDAIALHEDRILFSVASASSATYDDQLFTLQSDIRKLNLLVNSILTAEERVLSPLLARTFSSQNFQKYVVPRIFRASKPKRVVIPWIVERCRVWGGDDVAQQYKDELPFTARFLYDRMWLPYYVSHVALVMKHLDTEMSGMLADGATDTNWFGCTIM